MMNSRRPNIAVVGATGAVGTAMLSILSERKFPLDKLFPVASARSAGDVVDFKGQGLDVWDVTQFDFSQVDIALFSAGSEVSATYVPIAAAQNCICIDNTSQFRYDYDVPLVIPEVNPTALGDFSRRNIIANPNCSTIQMLVALKPIYDAVGISRINVATYQAVSGAGRAGVKELAKQCGELLNGRPADVHTFPTQIAFNVIPHIDVMQDNGYTREEMKMVWETQKILDDDVIQVNPTAVRVPVFYGHSEAVHIETREKLTAAQAIELLTNAPGVECFPTDAYPTAVIQGTGEDKVYVGRVREDISTDLGLNLWVVADNVRKGAALNAVQIAEMLVQDYL